MAKNKTDDTVEATAAGEKKYRLEVLQKHCRKLFGVPTTAFVGATVGLKDGEYTVTHIKGIIEKWCRTEAK